MKVGITLPSLGTRTRATRDNILQTAIQAEKEGFDSVWTITRILWPLKPQSPYPASPDGVLPVEYETAFDPQKAMPSALSAGILLILMHGKALSVGGWFYPLNDELESA